MSITRSGGCQEVCSAVRAMLEKADLLTPQEVKHGPVFEALEMAAIVSKNDLKIALGDFAELTRLTKGVTGIEELPAAAKRLLEALK